MARWGCGGAWRTVSVGSDRSARILSGSEAVKGLQSLIQENPLTSVAALKQWMEKVLLHACCVLDQGSI